jgi:hypothetical protein
LNSSGLRIVPSTYNHEEEIRQLLKFIEHDPDLDLTNPQHRNWAAYMLATVRVETARTWHPVQEYGKGSTLADWWDYFESRYRGRYGNDQPGDGFRYRGRGYVQLTFNDNYKKFSFAAQETDAQRLAFKEHLNRFLAAIGKPPLETLDLVGDPKLATEPEIAYAIMSYGMRKGRFVDGHSLEFYVDGSSSPNFEGARAIVGGVNRPNARLVADWARRLRQVIDESLRLVRNGGFQGGSLGGWARVGDVSPCGNN